MEAWLQTLGEASLRAIVVAAGIAAILSGTSSMRDRPSAFSSRVASLPQQ